MGTAFRRQGGDRNRRHDRHRPGDGGAARVGRRARRREHAHDGRPDRNAAAHQGSGRRGLSGGRRHARSRPGHRHGEGGGEARRAARLRRVERRHQPVHAVGRNDDRGFQRAVRDECARRLGRLHRRREADGRRGARRRDRHDQLDLGACRRADAGRLLRHQGRDQHARQGARRRCSAARASASTSSSRARSRRR